MLLHFLYMRFTLYPFKLADIFHGSHNLLVILLFFNGPFTQFRYNGTTITCQALWMGVPVISLVGNCHASRVGLSILSSINMELFAANTAREYIAAATALAKNTDALAKIRSSMRGHLAISGLCDAVSFARQIEKAYRKMWQNWCQKQT